MRRATAPLVALLLLTPGCTATPARPHVAEPAAGASGGPLLHQSDDGDGDSFSDTSGRRYRLGMIDAPEVGTCYAAEATAERRWLLRDGFRAEVYAEDRHGRAVAAVTAADGTDVNVRLARGGFADDRYLRRSRAENPALAVRLTAAFAQARRDRAGLWGVCRR